MRVFLSHASVDVDLMNRIRHAIGPLAEVYCTELDGQAGVNVHRKIQQQIESSDLVIALLTDDGAKSKYVYQEIGYALHAKKLVVPLVSLSAANGELGMLQGIEYIAFDDADPGPSLARLSERVRGVSEAQAKALDQSIGILLIALGVVLLINAA